MTNVKTSGISQIAENIKWKEFSIKNNIVKNYLAI